MKPTAVLSRHGWEAQADELGSLAAIMLMKTHTIIPLLLCWSLCLGQAQAGITTFRIISDELPTIRILPDDIVQETIQQVQFKTNSFAVRWTYTEAGAEKMLAFREAHVGEQVRTEVGSYESTGGIAPFTSLPGCASYSEWRAGWLDHRTDKFFGVSEENAKKIMEGLKK